MQNKLIPPLPHIFSLLKQYHQTDKLRTLVFFTKTKKRKFCSYTTVKIGSYQVKAGVEMSFPDSKESLQEMENIVK